MALAIAGLNIQTEAAVWVVDRDPANQAELRSSETIFRIPI
jgi:hypothetical protein